MVDFALWLYCVLRRVILLLYIINHNGTSNGLDVIRADNYTLDDAHRCSTFRAFEKKNTSVAAIVK